MIVSVILAAESFTGIAAIITAAVALCGSLGTIYVGKRKADGDATTQAFEQQGKTIQDLREDNGRLRTELDTIRADNVQMRVENNQMRSDLASIREDVRKCHEEREQLREQVSTGRGRSRTGGSG